jgi:hypothetical protein
MEVEEAELLICRLVGELREQRLLAEKASRQAAALNKIIAGYLEMFPALGSLVDDDALLHLEYTDDDAPKGAEAVRIILQESPDQWFYVSRLVQELRERGWLPDSDNPANAVRTALERLINTSDSDVKKGRDSNNRVVYSYRPDDAPPLPPAGYDDEEPF